MAKLTASLLVLIMMVGVHFGVGRKDPGDTGNVRQTNVSWIEPDGGRCLPPNCCKYHCACCKEQPSNAGNQRTISGAIADLGAVGKSSWVEDAAKCSPPNCCKNHCACCKKHLDNGGNAAFQGSVSGMFAQLGTVRNSSFVEDAAKCSPPNCCKNRCACCKEEICAANLHS